MSKTREKKQTQVQSAGWMEGMIDLLRGSVLGLGIALAVLAVTAVLISVGVISNTKTHSAVIAACLLVNSLPGAFTENAQLFSKEIENSDCNPETLIVTGFTPEELSALLRS